TPEASRRFYHHEAQANGLKLKWIVDKIVITGVYPGSPAENSGVQFGDIVMSADSKEAATLQQVQQAKQIVVDRRGKKKTFLLETGIFQMDQTPKLTEISSEMALLTVPSFEGEFEDKDLFDADFVSELSRK